MLACRKTWPSYNIWTLKCHKISLVFQSLCCSVIGWMELEFCRGVNGVKLMSKAKLWLIRDQNKAVIVRCLWEKWGHLGLYSWNWSFAYLYGSTRNGSVILWKWYLHQGAIFKILLFINVIEISEHFFYFDVEKCFRKKTWEHWNQWFWFVGYFNIKIHIYRLNQK